jgi:hypothetical protein
VVTFLTLLTKSDVIGAKYGISYLPYKRLTKGWMIRTPIIGYRRCRANPDVIAGHLLSSNTTAISSGLLSLPTLLIDLLLLN